MLGVESMLKRECDLQEAIWELLSTEESYMLALKAVLEVFYVCLQELKREKFLDVRSPPSFLLPRTEGHVISFFFCWED